MTITLADCLWALLWAVVAAGLTWTVTIPVRRRWLVGLITSTVLIASAASLGALLSAVHTMVLPQANVGAIWAIAAISAAVACVAAFGAARVLVREKASVRAAISELAAGGVPRGHSRPDGTELGRLRDELATSAQALADARAHEAALESARRELIAWVSHDLRTPLAGLRAMAEALEDGVAGSPDAYYKQIGASVQQLSAMVDDLFEFSRIQSGAPRRRTDHVTLNDIASDCLAALEPLAITQGVHLNGRADGAVTIAGDGAQLNRAVTNLVANAIRHTRPGGVVSLRLTANAAAAELTVADQCGGIAADALPRLFDVGYRAEAARTPRSDQPTGAGLGLAITRAVVEAHAGTIDVENTGPGCRFRIRLPVDTGQR
jgi:signal transduction histidine kinase